MRGRLIRCDSGFTLIEIVVVIIILGILSTIAITRMGKSIESAKYEQTKKELDNLAYAMIGNPRLYTKGARTDFGFVGDNGTLPSSLNDLVQNPGDWTTWNGPYIERGLNADDFSKDAWGVSYTYTDTLIRSTGSGSYIDKLFIGTTAALLSNGVEGTVTDADMIVPGAVFHDSISVRLIYPDGAGSLATSVITPDAHGYFSYSNVPIGNHILSVIYIPDADTVFYSLAVCPGRDLRLNIVFPADLW